MESSVKDTIKALFSNPVYTELKDSPEYFAYRYENTDRFPERIESDRCQPRPIRQLGGNESTLSYLPYLQGNQWSRSAAISTLKREIARRVKELFKGHRGKFSKYMANDAAFFPSTSANYINSRDKGGSVTSIKDHPTLAKILCVPRLMSRIYSMRKLIKGFYPLFDHLPTDLVENRILPFLDISYFAEEIGAKFELSLFGSLGLNTYKCLTTNERGLVYDDVPIRQCIKFMTEIARTMAPKERNFIRPVGLAESFKVRVITASPPLRSYVLKPLQQYLFSVLKKKRCFRLIGEPVSEKYISQILGKYVGWEFLSGDYKAATDNLMSELSEYCGHQINKYLGLDDSDLGTLFIDALVNHEISPEDYWGATGEDIDSPLQQCNGQLMGSVVSFPVLCIVNAALCAICLEEGLKCNKFLDDLPLMINGDDCAFPTDNFIHSLWGYFGTSAGLSPSLGKYFKTREFVQINSRNFIPGPLVLKRERGPYMEEFAEYVYCEQYFTRFEEIPFVNLRLLVGNPRSTACEIPEEFKLTSIGSRQRDFILDGPDFLFSQLATLFYARNEDLIKGSRLPWFVPTKYGGLGLNYKLTPFGGDLSDTDRAICGLINAGKFKNPPKNIKVEDDWKTNALVMDILESNKIQIKEVDQPCEDFGRFYGLLCLSVLCFYSRDDINPNLAHWESTHGKQRRKIYEYQYRLRKARRFWSKAQTHPGVCNKKYRRFNPFQKRYQSVGPVKSYGDLAKDTSNDYNLKDFVSGKFEELSSYLIPMEL
jgi:hypothetical protein